MKLAYYQRIVLTITLFLGVAFSLNARDYFLLKIYHLKNSDQLLSIESYFQNTYLPALHRAGVKKIGVFKPIETDAEANSKIIVLIPVKNMENIEKIDNKLIKDIVYLKDGEDYINSSWDNPPYQRIETIILKAFSEMPSLKIPNHKTKPKERVYELRSYEGPTEKLYRKKVEMFNEGGEIKLFNKLGFEAVFYGEVIAGSTMPNLMYMTTFSDMKSHDEHWANFRSHPDWKTLSGREEYKHTVSRSVIQLLRPTSYSDI